MGSHYLWWEGETQVITTCRSLSNWLRHIVREMAMYSKTSGFINSIISVSRVTLLSGWSQALRSQACLQQVLPAQSPLGEQDREGRNHTAGFKTNISSVHYQSCANSLTVMMIFCGLLLFAPHKTTLRQSNQWLHQWSTACFLQELLKNKWKSCNVAHLLVVVSVNHLATEWQSVPSNIHVKTLGVQRTVKMFTARLCFHDG